MPQVSVRHSKSLACEGLLLGVEHEYRVMDEHARRLGAAPMLTARGGIHGRRIDPGDANAWRTSDSAVLTVDGDEAEMASPLLQYDANLGRALSAATHNGTSALADVVLPHQLVGYSTHLSASTAATRCRSGDASRDPAQRLLYSFGPALALLSEPRHGGGILVRPRHSRIEVCTEYVVDRDLVALAVFFGAAVAAVESKSLRRAVEGLSLDVVVAPSVHRFGWFLDPATSLGHWYREGRATPVRTTAGGLTTLGIHLRAAWSLLRPLAAGATSGELIRLVDERVRGAAKLPCERDGPLEALEDDFEFRNVLGPHRFGRISLECLAVTWTAAVYSATDGLRTVLLTVPTAQLSSFLDQCEVDGTLPALLSRQRRIRASVDAHRPRAQRRVDPSSLIPRERLPDGSMPPRVPGSGRSSKERSGEEQPQLRSSARPRRTWPLIAAIAGVLASIVVGVAAVNSSRDDDPAEAAANASLTTLGAPPIDSTATTATPITSTSVVSGTTVDVTATVSYAGTGVFSSFSSGLSQLPAAQQAVFIPIETARGLYPSPQGETMPVGATLVGPCDGTGPCTAALSVSGLAAGNALVRFSFLIDDFPYFTFELEPTGTGYRYSRAMGWNEAAAIGGFDECRSGDPIHTLDLELTPNGDLLSGELRAALDPLVISGAGGCWGIAYTIDISAVRT